jgi:hypothetical protein
VIGYIKFISRNEDYSFVSGADGMDYFLHFRDTQAKNIPLVGTGIWLDVTTAGTPARVERNTNRSSARRVVAH